MNKVCIWTQTYGSNREELFDYHALDKFDIEFRNNFDNYFTFHNSNSEFFEKIKNGKYFEQLNSKFTERYDSISYTECVRKSIEYLKSLGYDYMIYHEDDSLFQFSPNLDSEKHKVLASIVDYIKNQDFDMFSLEWSAEPYFENVSYEQLGDLRIYDTKSSDFRNFGVWEFDGGAYVAKIDFLLENLYDDGYFSIGDSWRGEMYLKDKWTSRDYTRKTFQTGLYRRYNLLGRNSDYRLFKEKLNKCFYEN